MMDASSPARVSFSEPNLHEHPHGVQRGEARHQTQERTQDRKMSIGASRPREGTSVGGSKRRSV